MIVIATAGRPGGAGTKNGGDESDGTDRLQPLFSCDESASKAGGDHFISLLAPEPRAQDSVCEAARTLRRNPGHGSPDSACFRFKTSTVSRPGNDQMSRNQRRFAKPGKGS